MNDKTNPAAQQPAAAGEEIMVNAAHDVYTLPLQPSGLSSGPRFVVHVPGPEQPASEVYVDFPQVGTAGPLAVVDGKVTLPDATMNDLIRHARTGYVEQPAAVDDLNAWRAAFVAERAMRYREGGMAIEQARIHAETDAARMAVLAAGQQQGGTQE